MKAKKNIIILFVAMLLATMLLFTACQSISEFSNYKKEKTEELQKYADELLSEYTYSEQFLQRIQETLNNGKETIDKASSYLEVDNAFSSAKRGMNKIPPLLDYHTKEIFDYANYVGSGKGRIKDSYLAQNRTYGIHYLNEDYDPNDPSSKQILEDTISPRYRANIITERSQLEEVFPEIPIEIDFENEMVLVLLFTMNLDVFVEQLYQIRKIEMDGEVLKVHVIFYRSQSDEESNSGMKKAIQPQIWQAVDVLKLDRIDVMRVEIIFTH